MKITHEEVLRVAGLARLDLTDEEAGSLAAQLSTILDYVDKLAELDLEGVEPLAHVQSVVNAFREDRVRPSLPRDKVLANAPQTELGCFKVPKVIES